MSTIEDRKRRLRVSLGPHREVERRTVVVPASGPIAAHVATFVTTTCGREVSSTLVTRRDDRVRCPECMGDS